MLTQSDENIIYKTTNLSNMRLLKRKYNGCKLTCSLPLQCTFNIKPIYCRIVGNYELSSDSSYNTILTFKEDCVSYLYITVKVYVTIALKTEPDVIVYSITVVQNPGIYPVLAGTNDYIITSHFNFPNC